jgi:hypothetical protein
LGLTPELYSIPLEGTQHSSPQVKTSCFAWPQCTLEDRAFWLTNGSLDRAHPIIRSSL